MFGKIFKKKNKIICTNCIVLENKIKNLQRNYFDCLEMLDQCMNIINVLRRIPIEYKEKADALLSFLDDG
jgi:hypothetical protein